MKQSKVGLLGTLALAGVLTLAMACGDDDNDAVGTSTPDTGIGATGTNGDNGDRAGFINDVDTRLTQLRGDISRLESEVATRTGSEREDAQARINDLRERADALEVDLARLQMATEDEFDSLRDDIEDEVDSAISDAEDLADDLGI